MIGCFSYDRKIFVKDHKICFISGYMLRKGKTFLSKRKNNNPAL